MTDLSARLQAALGDAYAVERVLGSGGFATVFLVRDLTLKRKLAVKVLAPELVASPTMMARFRREAETVAQLSHPHIVPLHFIGQKEDLLYLAMACVDGGSVADRLARERTLPTGDVARIIREVGGALAHAHRRSVVHRDIKPQNILVDGESGRSLVTDFGIARTSDAGSLTATGVVLGTASYLAPEQVTGDPVDHRADIYALGVMAYELLAGRTPFEGANATAIIMRRLAGPPTPIEEVRPEVPRDLAAVVARCLQGDPAHRFQDASELVAALEERRDAPAHKQHAPTRLIDTGAHRRRTRFIAVTLVVVAVGAAAALIPGIGGSGGTSVGTAAAESGMILIPSGTYRVGSEDPADSIANPARAVELTAFEIDSLEVTVGEYGRFADSSGVPTPWSGVPTNPRLPVTRVLWSEAAAYCASRRPEGRLPTDDEWEAAARGLESRVTPWIGVLAAPRANIGGAQRAPASVGSFPAGRTPEGIHDLIGNVWEWTSSRPRGSPTPSLGGSVADTMRTIRGGAFNSSAALATVWRSVPYSTRAARDDLAATGFRCVSSPKGR